MVHIPGINTAQHTLSTAFGAVTLGKLGINPKTEGKQAAKSAFKDLTLFAGMALVYALSKTSYVQPHLQKAFTQIKGLNSYQKLANLIPQGQFAQKVIQGLGQGAGHLRDGFAFATKPKLNLGITAAVFAAGAAYHLTPNINIPTLYPSF